MPITVGNNIASLATVRSLDRTTGDLSSTFERLSSGQRITRASDDAAGLAVASSLNIKSRIFGQGIRNVNDGLSLVAIAEGALGNLQDIITRVGELANQAANGTLSGRQRVALDREANALLKEYNRIVQSTSFNGNAIIDGTSDTVTLQHGVGDEQTTTLGIGNQLGITAGDGTFASVNTFSTGSHPQSIISVDLNGDGFDDLISADYASSCGSVLLSNGNGTFQARKVIGGISNAWDVKVADFNNDGKKDLAFGTWDGSQIFTVLGNGDGTFGNLAKYTLQSTSGSQITTGDFNNDGTMDIVTSSMEFLKGKDDGTFELSSASRYGPGAYGVSSGDLNNDGILDIVGSY